MGVLERLDEDFVLVVLEIVLELGEVGVIGRNLDFLLVPIVLHQSERFLSACLPFLELAEVLGLLVDDVF
jgi:hypothetical protein